MRGHNEKQCTSHEAEDFGSTWQGHLSCSEGKSREAISRHELRVGQRRGVGPEFQAEGTAKRGLNVTRARSWGWWRTLWGTKAVGHLRPEKRIRVLGRAEKRWHRRVERGQVRGSLVGSAFYRKVNFRWIFWGETTLSLYLNKQT